MHKKHLLLPAFFLLAACASSSYYDDESQGGVGGKADDALATPTYLDDIQPLLLDKCAGCHETGGFAGVPFASSFDVATQLGSAFACDGKPVYECMLERVQAGEMPFGAGCSGDPLLDADNTKCLDQEQQDLLADWIAAGAPFETTEPPPPPTYVDDVQPLLLEKCGACHQDGGFGGVAFASSFDAATQMGSMASCDGKPVYECMLERVQAGEMPFAAGCTGDPVLDANNTKCLDQDQQDLLQGWVEAGAPFDLEDVGGTPDEPIEPEEPTEPNEPKADDPEEDEPVPYIGHA